MPTIRPLINTTPDHPIVQFREAKELIDLKVEIQKLLQSQGWGLGTLFHVQFVSHDKTMLIKTARFIVSSERKGLRTLNPDSQSPMQKDVEMREAKQVDPWFWPNGKIETEIKWNFGAKTFDVKQGDKVIKSFKKKEEAEQYLEKAA